jgi:hypothetical protein
MSQAICARRRRIVQVTGGAQRVEKTNARLLRFRIRRDFGFELRECFVVARAHTRFPFVRGWWA